MRAKVERKKGICYSTYSFRMSFGLLRGFFSFFSSHCLFYISIRSSWCGVVFLFDFLRPLGVGFFWYKMKWMLEDRVQNGHTGCFENLRFFATKIESCAGTSGASAGLDV